jgi:hypothetical protein
VRANLLDVPVLQTYLLVVPQLDLEHRVPQRLVNLAANPQLERRVLLVGPAVQVELPALPQTSLGLPRLLQAQIVSVAASPANESQILTHLIGPMPSGEEIVAAIPPEGITINGLVMKFKQKVDKGHTQNFIKLVKSVSYVDKAKGLIFRRE